MLFNIYDLDGSGALDYKEFSGAVFGKVQGGGSGGPGGAGGASPARSSPGKAGGGGGGARSMEELAE